MYYRIDSMQNSSLILKKERFLRIMGLILEAIGIPIILAGLIFFAMEKEAGVFAFGVFLFLAGRLTGRAMRSFPDEIIVDQQGVHLKKSRKRHTLRGIFVSGYREGVDEDGDTIYIQNHEADVFDLASFGRKKNALEFKEIVDKYLRMSSSRKENQSAILPKWIFEYRNADRITFSWLEIEIVKNFIQAPLIICSFIYAMVSFSGGSIWWFVLPSSLIFLLLFVSFINEMRFPWHFLEIYSDKIVYSKSQSKQGVKLKIKNTIQRADIRAVSYSFERSLSNGNCIFICDDATLKDFSELRMGAFSIADLKRMFRALHRHFKIMANGRDVVDILDFRDHLLKVLQKF